MSVYKKPTLFLGDWIIMMKTLLKAGLLAVITVATANNDALKTRVMLDNIKEVQKVTGKRVEPRLAMMIYSCAYNAAHPDDPGKVGKGVTFKKIKADIAIERCKEALQNGGDEFGLVLSTLSRAYNKAERYDQSLYYAKKAVELNYPFANVMMAIHYNYGDGVEKSMKQQFRWYKKAATQGVTSAMRVTADNYIDAKGAKYNPDEAYFWALTAIENRDPKAFYQMARVLQEMAKTSKDPAKLLSLAAESIEIADENGINVKKEKQRILTALRPNHIAKDSVLHAKTIKGRMVGGVFVREEASSNWYIGEKPLQRDGNTYFYARTSHNNTVFSLWYKNGKSAAQSGWFIDFLYAGSNAIKQFDGVSVLEKLQGQTNYINLDTSGHTIEELAGTYRMTARISYRDVLVLQNATDVKFYYTATDKRTPTYTMNLNNEEYAPEKQYHARTVIPKLVQQVAQKDPSCCDAPPIEPLGEQYRSYYKFCEDRERNQFMQEKPVEQDCHDILKRAQPTTDIMVSPLKTNLENLIRELQKVGV